MPVRAIESRLSQRPAGSLIAKALGERYAVIVPVERGVLSDRIFGGGAPHSPALLQLQANPLGDLSERLLHVDETVTCEPDPCPSFEYPKWLLRDAADALLWLG